MNKKIEVNFFEDIAKEVKDIHEAMLRINSGKLTKEAIVTLLQRSTGESRSSIKNVLYGLENINRYLK